MRFFHILVISSVMLAVSCTPQYETTYSFISPKNKEERKCANECIVGKSNCVFQCNQTLGVTSMTIDNRSERSLGSLFGGNEDKSATCMSQCDINHKMCHENCGGKVIVNKKCVAHCK